MFWKKKKSDESALTDQKMQASETRTAEESAPSTPKKGLFTKLRERLRSTSESIVKKARTIFRLRGKIDDDLLDDLEEALISADVGMETTLALMEELRNRIRREKKTNSTDINWLTDTLQSLMRDMLEQGDRTLKVAEVGPSIYLIVGVNGVGKTTAIGKMAARFKSEGKQVLIVAADTFRAAAIEQLEIWSKRADVPIVLGSEGADPSSVVYNAMSAAKTQKPDVVVIDTAGRLHTKTNLLQELSKMSRVISREFDGAPQETLLVLDASTGQNAITQAKTFLQSCGLTGLILTKMDGTAKGGVILAVHKQLGLPVKFIGVGEGIDDLEPFDPDAFTRALFAQENQNGDSD
ncbi:MAG: signal recognition particle-docking protein FtsY [Candidatus Omnitrophota bacterium]|nr:MAG: signal recognition particle-docking protein FtsY [Candidatus Omnitrophota bacterium]